MWGKCTTLRKEASCQGPTQLFSDMARSNAACTFSVADSLEVARGDRSMQGSYGASRVLGRCRPFALRIIPPARSCTARPVRAPPPLPRLRRLSP